MRIRREPESNYFAIFHNGKTFRFAINASLPITQLRHPEILDCAITAKCYADCPWCYVSSVKEGKHYSNIVVKAREIFGNLDLDQRPFQIAIGGEGEPTLHPDFIPFLKSIAELEIVPNYTTNGMHLSDEILKATKEFCGGVAVSCHPHLEKVWRKAANQLIQAGIATCLHIIVGEYGTSEKFWQIYDSTDGIYCYVALPYQAVGRAKEIDVEPEWNCFFREAMKLTPSDLAVGAPFHSFLLKHPEIVKTLGISMYDPEILSGYIILDDDYKTLLVSSYNQIPRGEK
ncbi:MAG: Radical SAM protein [Candidatus Woesebacteria bacterium GW2011_GWB1_39_12]|uniref:Radical SAM protein n=1 Tax=Candidatus Woesebacteria bacterium GW2011_GWB1_39_12 TaxID=1618574 RepID=A0A0G0PP81_9BACT|nr:MAG: Radical SAM protein [Candidatus Woesebacteria bacterium GW2011_GWB1_39_12]